LFLMCSLLSIEAPCIGASVMIFYVALPFIPVEEGGLAPGQPLECPNASAAIYRAEAMARNERYAGAVAFSRRGDPDVGEYEDAEVLRTFGEVPDDFGRP
jgi:hypothetical protein